MLKLGITGGIGSGKSIVSGLFAQLGVPVFDSDSQARKLINTDPAIRQALMATFGKDIYLPLEQGLDRKKLASIVFNNPQALAALNAITHPPVIEAAKRWMAHQQSNIKGQNTAISSGGGAPPVYVIKEAALLFESGSNRSLDFILGVYADQDTRIRRVIRRDQLSREAVLQRMEKQMDEEEKMDHCDGVLINDGRHLLWPQVIGWHRFFLEKIARKFNHTE